MELIPCTSFSRIVQRYGGYAVLHRLTCSEQFRVMAFALLAWRESLRDIEVSLGANARKHYAMGFRHSIHRLTLADANESRDWRIWADLASVLIRRASKLYLDEDLGVELKNTVYALDATTIDLYLSLFAWASFGKAKAAVKLHTLLDARLCSSHHPHHLWQEARGQCAVDLVSRARRVLSYGQGLFGLCSPVPNASGGCLPL